MEKSFYPDKAYNKSKRLKFLLFFGLTALALLATMTILIVSKANYIFIFGIMFFVLILLIILPTIFKNYPTNGKPQFVFKDKEIIYQEKYSIKLNNIVAVKVNILLPVETKNPIELKEQMAKVALNPTECNYLGDVDILIKGDRKNDTLYTTVIDCVGALQCFIDFGVKDYKLNVCAKKLCVQSEYKFQKTLLDEEKNENLSKKERRKQLL